MISTRTELITSATHTRITLSHALNRGELTRISKGHLLPTQTWNNLHPNDQHYVCILAHLNEYPANILAAQSAAIAWGISSLSPPRHVQVRGTGGRRENIQRIQDTLTADSPIVYTPEGIPTVTPLTAITTCVKTLPFREGLVLVKRPSALRAGTGYAHLRGAQERALICIWCGCRTARLVGHELSPHSESVAETCMRLLLDDQGIRYKQQETIICEGHAYRVDFLLHATSLHGILVILEVDGNIKYNAKEDLVREKNRQDRLLHAGYAVVRVSAKDAIYRPRRFAGAACCWSAPNLTAKSHMCFEKPRLWWLLETHVASRRRDKGC